MAFQKKTKEELEEQLREIWSEKQFALLDKDADKLNSLNEEGAEIGRMLDEIEADRWCP